MPTSHCRCAPLPDLVVILVEGVDAEAFLTAQLGRRPPAATEHHAPLAAWHDPKGRVQALFRVVRLPDTFWLVTPADIAAAVAADLRRYVLRARVSLRVTDELRCIALVGPCTAALTRTGIELAADNGAAAVGEGVAWLRVGSGLVHGIGTADTLEAVSAALPDADAADAAVAEIRLGIPSVTAPLRGKFLPQMLNLDELGAVEFDKGCYPGQEIIARTHNLGTVKRRLQRYVADASAQLPAPGSDLFDEAGEAVGVVISSAYAPGGMEVLAVVQLAAMAGPLATAPLDGPRLELQPLP